MARSPLELEQYLNNSVNSIQENIDYLAEHSKYLEGFKKGLELAQDVMNELIEYYIDNGFLTTFSKHVYDSENDFCNTCLKVEEYCRCDFMEIYDDEDIIFDALVDPIEFNKHNPGILTKEMSEEIIKDGFMDYTRSDGLRYRIISFKDMQEARKSAEHNQMLGELTEEEYQDCFKNTQSKLSEYAKDCSKVDFESANRLIGDEEKWEDTFKNKISLLSIVEKKDYFAGYKWPESYVVISQSDFKSKFRAVPGISKEENQVERVVDGIYYIVISDEKYKLYIKQNKLAEDFKALHEDPEYKAEINEWMNAPMGEFELTQDEIDEILNDTCCSPDRQKIVGKLDVSGTYINIVEMDKKLYMDFHVDLIPLEQYLDERNRSSYENLFKLMNDRYPTQKELDEWEQSEKEEEEFEDDEY